jgi:uncharacterized Zn-binding protein involved in type VI secretion
MPLPAARMGDSHICPLFNGPQPHVGGTISTGCPTVLIGGKPAARIFDVCACGGPANMVARGSATVLIGGQPAARMFDQTAHGGVVISGCPTVLIGG